MIASVMSAATLTPTSKIDQSNPASPMRARTFSSRGRARCPVRKRMRSAMRHELTLAVGQCLFELRKGFDDLRAVERLQSLGILEVDATREDLDHALGRFGFKFGRGVAGKDDDGNAAFSSLREDIGRQ